MAEAAPKPVINIAEVPLKNSGKGEKFVAKVARLGPLIGSNGIGCTLTVVPPGKRAFPFHRHHVIDELFYIVSGAGDYRYGKQSHPVRTGDVIAAPAGAEAHQLLNTGAEDLRFLAISTKPAVDVVDYPDSDKFAVAAGIKNSDFTTATFKYVGRPAPTDYWDGE
jgi:uncharacterized cupin superfamily protein